MSSLKKNKFVIVIDHDLSVGLISNTAAVLSLTVGRLAEGIIGPDLHDRAGARHSGITAMPIAILKADRDQIREIREKAAGQDNVLLVDFCNVAQISKNYDDYQSRLLQTPV